MYCASSVTSSRVVFPHTSIASLGCSFHSMTLVFLGPVQVLTLCPNLVTLNMADNRAITTHMITQCINAIQRREDTHKLTIGCGGCNVELEDLNLPSYVDINWYSYCEAYYTASLDDDFYDDASEDSYEEEVGYDYNFGFNGYDDLHEPDFDNLDII